jgi:hypothetical protein
VGGRETGDERAEAEKIGEEGLGGEIMCREKTGDGGIWGRRQPRRQERFNRTNEKMKET